MLPTLGNLDLRALELPTGPSAGSKRKIGSERQLIEIKRYALLEDTLNFNGCASIAVPNAQVDTTRFIQKVDIATRDWFYARLNEALSPLAPTPIMQTGGKKKFVNQEKMDEWTRGRNDWNALSNQTKAQVLASFDLNSPEGRDNVFIPKKRKHIVNELARSALGTRDSARTSDMVEYFEDRLRYVKQGDSRMALGSMYKSWTQKGFGKWAHITTSQGIRASLALRDELAENKLDTQLNGSSHMIYKPPFGDELSAHTDGPRPDTTITIIEEFHRKNNRFPTTIEWMQDQGVQSLVHFDGGAVDGYTYAIGPMTPTKLYHCLKAIKDYTLGATDAELFSGKVEDDDEDDDDGKAKGSVRRFKFLTGGDGPTFMKWKENLDKFNAILKMNNEEPIGEMPIRPASNDQNGAFVAIWANGFPHGSAPNKKRRITTTASLAVVSRTYQARDERVLARVNALAAIAADSSSVEQRARARATIASQTLPFYGGSTHHHPENAGMWFDPDKISSGTGGFYRSIAPTLEDAAEFEEAWEEGNQKYAPAEAEWKLYDAAKRAAAAGGADVRRPVFARPEDSMHQDGDGSPS